MNTLQALRTTLDQHAGDVHDDPSVARVAAVRGRARRVRQQRSGAVVGAAVLAVAGVVLVPSLGDRAPQPASAPDTLTSLGWTYRLDDTTDAPGDRVRLDLPASDLPRLVSWATTGNDQAVRVDVAGDDAVRSEASDFGDFAWLPPGFSGRVDVSGGEPGLRVATYALDASTSPSGVGSGPSTFRADVAGRVLAGAAVGEPGQATITVPVDAERGTLDIAYTCEGLPRGYQVRVGVVGEQGYVSSGGGCADAGFDPGGSPNLGMPGRWGPGSALRMWVVRGGRPVADGALPDVTLGLGAYAAAGDQVTLAGHDFDRVVEHAGKVWRLEDSATGSGARLPRLTVPADGTYVVSDWVVATGRVRYAVSIDGDTGDRTWLGGVGESGGGPEAVGPGQEVGLDVRGGDAHVVDAALALYRRVD